MPLRRKPTSKSLPDDGLVGEYARLAKEQAERHIADFDEDLWSMAAKFMARRGSQTLDATDIDNARAWLTRPPRKAGVRDAVASVVVFLAAGTMAFGINNLTSTPPVKGAWFVVATSVAFGLFAEVFRRWEYD